jgi:DNA-binding response OmpR family regulator
MPVKILLADKSITIQKVVEMLFSGKEYEVLCVSDGETALSEAERAVPDVVLADIDLPRVDGYSFAARLKQVAALARTPVILMMSRDDVFDEAKARHVSIIDHIAKPFESQELIGKVKKAVSAAPPRPAEPAPAAARSAPATQPQKPPVVPPAPVTAPKQPLPTDIFDIIQEAPTQADLKRTPAQPTEEESVYEVEPVVEVEEQLTREEEQVLPVGEKAVEEMRAGLGLSGKGKPPEPDIVSFESLDMATTAAEEYQPQQAAPRRSEPYVPPMREAREYVPPPPETEVAAPAIAISEERLRNMAQETITRMALDYFKKMPPVQPPQVSEEMLRSVVEESVTKIVRDVAREVVEKVAWEVIPDLAEMLIKAEIERLKAGSE